MVDPQEPRDPADNRVVAVPTLTLEDATFFTRGGIDVIKVCGKWMAQTSDGIVCGGVICHWTEERLSDDFPTPQAAFEAGFRAAYLATPEVKREER